MSVLTQSDRAVPPRPSHGARRLPALVQGLRQVVRLWLLRRRTRVQLAHLPPHILHDIGIAPDDARIEMRKPFWRP